MTIHEECEARGIARWALVQLKTHGAGPFPDDIAAYVTERFGTDESRSVLGALTETAGVRLGSVAGVAPEELATAVEAREAAMDRGER